VPGGLPERLRSAVAATPRDRFVHRFRLSGGHRDRIDRFRLPCGPVRDLFNEGSLPDNDADPVGALADIYSDAVMIHVDAAGERLPSRTPSPAMCSGYWIYSTCGLGNTCSRSAPDPAGSRQMARLVGEGGHVTGIEIIPELAAQSQADLAGLGIDSVSVHAADGAQGHAAGAPFDRVMITAACWDMPAVLFDQVGRGRARAACRIAQRRLPGDGSAARRE
jgi:Protein-L-isoaspartate(D-aspartate) O-methyltransferase (PCMT)